MTSGPVAEAERLEAEAVSSEVPGSTSCIRVAEAWQRAGDDVSARAWALRTVDAGDDRYLAWRVAARILRELAADPPGGRVAVLGTANVSSLVPCVELALAHEGLDALVHEEPYGQYWQAALDPSAELAAFDPRTTVLVPEHHALPRTAVEAEPERWLDEQLGRWTDVWDHLRSWSDADLVQVGFVAPADDVLGDLAGATPGSFRRLVHRLDELVADRARDERVGFVDAEALAASIGKRNWFDPRYWHAAKHGYSMAVAPALARRIAAVVAARRGASRKVVVVDLDGTLWDGVIGDDGLEGIGLTGPKGEAHRDFQAALLELTGRGVVLAVASKNDEVIARAAFQRHPDMVLSIDDVSSFAANWESKPSNIRRIAQELGVGLDSLVFVDDNPAERDAVRRALPDVDVLALPPDPSDWRQVLLDHPQLQPASCTEDDRARTEQYRARAMAHRVAEASDSLEEFQRSLQMVATVGPVDGIDFDRVVQLVGKTNQFNLTSRRHTADAVHRMVAGPDWWCTAIRLSDRFADHGVVGVVLAQQVDDVLDVDSYLMSCRVIGRGLERVVRDLLVDEARRRGVRAIRGRYVPTGRNRLVSQLWPDLGFRPDGEDPDGTTHHELVVDAPLGPLQHQIEVRRRGSE